MVLVCIMTLALFPVVSPVEVSAAEATGTTALFNENATYLLQERFNEPKTVNQDNSTGSEVFSGWDIDYRGGKVDARTKGGYGIATLTDSDGFEKISMSRKLMSHAGAGLVLEADFKYTSAVDSGFYYEMSGGGNTALKISVDRVDATTPENCAITVNGQSTGVACVKNTVYHIKAEFSGSKVAVWINGKSVANVDYVSPTSVIDEIEVGTLEETVATIDISYIYVYVNYTVNESFLSSSIKDWWDIANGSVTKAPGSPYTADPNGFALNSVEELEPSYAVDAPRVFIKADTASDFTMVGANVDVDDVSDTIGGRKDIVKAVGVKAANDYQVGVKLPDGFSFEEDDVLTYSFDIYSDAEVIKPDVYIRDHSDYDPMRVEYNVAISQSTWTTITKTLTYAEMMNGVSSGKFSEAGNYAVYLRPRTDNDQKADNDPTATIYLDNFTVKVAKADDKYYSNAVTGERLNYEMALNEWDKNVVYAKNMDQIQYVTDPDPKQEKGGKVLMTGHNTTSLDHSSVIAIKLTNNFGEALGGLKMGDIIDISLDVFSPTEIADASTASNRGVMVRQSSTAITNGATGPAGYECKVAPSIKIPANDWTTLKGTGVVTESAVNGRTLSDYIYVTVRLPYADVLYLSDLKVTIRNPRDSVITVPFSAKAESAADITWKGAGTADQVAKVVDDKDPSTEGRGNVIKATVEGYSNNNNVGFSLGSSFQFRPGDVISWSADVYSSTVNPDIWIRNGSAQFKYSQNNITTNTWKTISGSFTYEELYASDARFAEAGNYAIYIRPRDPGTYTIYIDNFAVSVRNSGTEYISDLNTGAKFSRYYPLDDWDSDILYASGMSKPDYTDKVLKTTFSSAGYSSVIGFMLRDSFGLPVKNLKAGDIINISLDLKSDVNQKTTGVSNAGIMLRNGTFYSGGNGPSETEIKLGEADVLGGNWKTLDISYTVPEDKSISDLWYITVRLPSPATIYLDNISVSVVKPEYALEQVSNAVLQKSFDELSGKQSFSFNVLVPNVDNGADGFGATFGGVDFKADGGKFKVGNTEVYSYRKNVWYKIEIQTDGRTADIYVNGVKKATGISAVGDMNSIAFENTSGRQIIVDDIQVCKAFDFADYDSDNGAYPSTPNTVKTSYNLGMVSYPMWREGIQYGWDFISSFEERTPALGYYTGGSPEVADWNNKWLLEHGIDHMIFPMPRPDGTNNPIKMAVRGEELHDGFLNSKYKKTAENPDGLGFAIMITQPTNERYDSPAEFKEYVQPYLIEHYFKNPAYKKITIGGKTRLVVYNYDFASFAKYLGDTSTYNNVNQVLVNLDEEVRNLGLADGIMFVTDLRSSKDEVKAYLAGSYSFKSNVYKWRYTYGTDDIGGIKEEITGENDSNENGYAKDNNTVASIPMGFNTTPWYANWVGTISPEDVQTLCTDVKNAYNSYGSEPNLFLFTCWDEWGEGHHFAPTEKNGVVDFSYLNAIKKAFAGGNDVNSEAPSDKAKKRIGVLYPEGRQMLKLRDRVVYNATDFKSANELGYLDLTDGSSSWSGVKSNKGETNGVTPTEKITGSFLNYIYNYTYKGSGGYAQQVTWNFSDVKKGSENYDKIDIRDVTAIKIDGYADNSPEMVLKLGTSKDEFPGEYRFSGVASNNRSASIILLPDNRTKLLNKANTSGDATITRAQFNLTTYTRANSEFDINRITFYTGDLPGTTVELDGNSYTLISAPKKAGTNNDVTMIPAYKFLVDLGAKVTWNKEGTGGTLTAVKDGITAVYVTTDRNVVDENGEEMAKAPEGAGAIYEDGNLYVAYDVLLKPFGYTVDVVDGVITYSNKFTGKSYNQNDYKWDFEIDGDLDGWYCGETEPYPIFVKNGMLHQRAITRNSVNQDDAKIFRDGVNIPKTSANYFAMDFKKTDYGTNMKLRLYDTGKFNTESGLVYNIPIPKSDNIQKLIVDLNKGTATIDGNEINIILDNGTYAELNSTSGITDLRIDTMDSGNLYGSIYIDSIEFTKNHPAPFTVEAYSFGENVLDDNNNPYWWYSDALNKDGTTSAGFGMTPYIVTDGEYSNVYKIQPIDSKTTGLAGITRLKQSEYSSDATKDKDLGYHVKDKWVKVSFDYKGYGDCTEFKFENRDTGAPGEGNPRYPNEKHLDGESFGGKVSDKWQHFEEYFKVDEINDSRRWFAIRATRKSSSGDGALLVKDWKIHILDEVTEVDYFTDSGVAIRVFDNVGAEIDPNTVVHVGAFNTENMELTGFDSGSTIEAKDSTTPYYYMAPTGEATELRTYIWNGFEPLTQPFVFTRKAQ